LWETFISRSVHKPDWVDVLIALLPLPLIFLVVLIPEPFQPVAKAWIEKNWGNLASVWGLGVSVYVLWVAQGAKTAAKKATEEAEEAARIAKASSRTRGALEDLQTALAASRQVSNHAGVKNWQVVRLKAEEVMESCRIIVNRWEDSTALNDSKNSLNQAITMMRTIAEEASKDSPNPLRIIKTQHGAHDHISAVEGKVQKEQDSRST
jgi:hypothetical protein